MNHQLTSPRARGITILGAALLALAACGGKGSTTPKSKGLTIGEAGLGGIVATTRVDTATIQQMFPDTVVKVDPENDDIQEAWKGSERLFYVVGASARRPEDGVFNVQVTHASIPGPNGWVVGQNLASVGDLDMCECWQDLRVCFKKGTHTAVAIDHDDCEGLPEVGTAIVGRPIARIIWNPRPWPEIADYDQGDSDPCGGGWEGGEEGDPCGGGEWGE
jgi:hypothetical protein